MEVISGIVLMLVVIGIVGILVREWMGKDAGAVLRKYAQVSAEDIEDPLVGEIGQVLEHKEGAERMKVRIRGERWSAKPAGGVALPVGTAVRVTAVNGLVLDVEEHVSEQAEAAETAVEEQVSEQADAAEAAIEEPRA